ncbi:MAG TPA: Chromate resistance protein ChrB [Chloroflexota bacterium]|nr:Chromate resistance protein ChrB [Chloroflexota bacterium]
MRTWLLLQHRVPTEPSAGRVSVWRKMKRLGGVLLQDAVWVMPATPWTREQLQWLAAEIVELGGEARVWEAQVAIGEEETLVHQFQTQVDSAYAEILADLDRADADRATLARRYQQVRTIDHFHSALGERLRAALLTRNGADRT